MIDKSMAFVPTYFAASFGVEGLINTQKKIAYFIKFLDNGISPIEHHSDQNVSEFAQLFVELTDEILCHLIERGRDSQTDIVINKDESIFTLQEKNNDVLVSLEMGKFKVTRILSNTLLSHIQKKLINDIIFYSDWYQKSTLTIMLNHIMFDAIDDDLASTMNAVEHILNSADEETDVKLKLAAAKHVFQHDATYSTQTIKSVAKMLIRQKEGCLVPLIQESEQILLNAELHSPKNIAGALFFLFNFPLEKTTVELKLAAAYHIFQHDQDYAPSTIDHMMRIILRHPVDCLLQMVEASEDKLINAADYTAKSVRGALTFVLYCPGEKSSSALKEAAARHVFQHNQHYSSKIITDIAEMVICNTENCEKMPPIDAAKHILMTKDEHASISIRSACIYVAHHSAHFSIEVFNCAASFIGQYSEQFPAKVITNTAIRFIQQNRSFFIAPSIDNRQFAAFFIDRKKEAILQLYSDELDKALRADPIAHPIAVNGSLSQFKTNFALWSSGRFVDVISKNEGVAQFILQKANDPTIILWNSHHELTDAKGRRAVWQEKNRIMSQSNVET